MIDYCKERNHSVSITSNALFVKPVTPEMVLESGVDSLTFSIDSVEGEVEDAGTEKVSKWPASPPRQTFTLSV